MVDKDTTSVEVGTDMLVPGGTSGQGRPREVTPVATPVRKGGRVLWHVSSSFRAGYNVKVFR